MGLPFSAMSWGGGEDSFLGTQPTQSRGSLNSSNRGFSLRVSILLLPAHTCPTTPKPWLPVLCCNFHTLRNSGLFGNMTNDKSHPQDLTLRAQEPKSFTVLFKGPSMDSLRLCLLQLWPLSCSSSLSPLPLLFLLLPPVITKTIFSHTNLWQKSR